MFTADSEIAILTVDELQFAMASAEAAATWKMPSESMRTRGRPMQIGDVSYRFTDHPLNHAAMAVLDAFKHDEAKGRSALWRVLMLFQPIMNHEGRKKWIREKSKDEWEVREEMLEAIATIPCTFAQPPDIAKVFALADAIAERTEPTANASE